MLEFSDNPGHEEDVALAEIGINRETAQLMVYNDDVNTFDWVIQSLMEICTHTFEQSEQLSLIIHYKGKACVKTGSMAKLKPMKDALVDRGLSAVIESMVKE